MKKPVTGQDRNLFGEVFAPFKQAMDLINPHLYSVEEKIRQQSRLFDPAVAGYISYVVTKGGKHLRPTLALLAGGATGRITTGHIDLAVILELIHIATLVHDDIIDEAELRRNHPTANAKWGNALSVLLGDCLFSHALRLATNFSNQEISRKIADASAEVCSGEIVQMQRRFDSKLNLADYYRIIEMKTAALFAVACELGAFISEANPETISALCQFGRRLGIAYQVYDDCLDLVGDESRVGKTLGTDLKKGKFTLPVLLILHQQKQEDNQASLRDFILSEEVVDVETIVSMVRNAGAVHVALQIGKRWVREAREHLTSVPKNRYVCALDSVALQLGLMFESLK